MQFGYCTSIDNAAAVKAAGWDYVEEHVQKFFQGHLPDLEWTGLDRLKKSPLPVPAANTLLPKSLNVTGPEASIDKLRPYMETILRRAQQAGLDILVFGSGPARRVPEGWDMARARQQMLDFIRMSADIAFRHGVTLVAEHLNTGETNIMNSVAEAMTYVKDVDHPNFQCLVDSFHFWVSDENLDDLEKAMPWIRHVHLADKEGRVPCGQSGKSDYRPFFRVLKQGSYDGRLSVEAPGFNDLDAYGASVLEYVKQEWTEA